MKRAGRWALVTSAVVLAFALLVTGLTLGIALPPFGLLAPLLDPGALDYAFNQLRGLSPLSRSYIADVLGDAIPVGARGGGGGPSPGSDLPGAPSQSTGPAPVDQVAPLSNDDISDARTIGSTPYSAATNTAGASREPGEPRDCGPLGGGTIWYRYTPASDIGLFGNTFGSRQATSLGVYVGKPGALRNVGCDTDRAGNALWEFPAKAGATYYFQVAGPLGGGRSVFNLEPLGTIRLASHSPSGDPGDGTSSVPSLSADGRRVAFQSNTTNLVPGTDSTCLARDPESYGAHSFNRTFDEVTTYGPCWRIIVRDLGTDEVMLASVSSSGEPANSWSGGAAISGNGRYVAFSSDATNLVPRDTNEIPDVFVHDLLTRRTERVSVDSAGRQMTDDPPLSGAEGASISFDGRYIAFESAASNLVDGDTNLAPDVFVHDRLTHATTRISVNSTGEEAEPIGLSLDNVDRLRRFSISSAFPKLSLDGRYVAFRSAATNLVPDDHNHVADTFLHDRADGRTIRVSVDSAGREGNGETVANWSRIAVSGDGRYVAFSSRATNLVPNDSSTIPDVFVRDTVAGSTVRVNVSSDGAEAGGRPFTDGSPCSISADGRYVAFGSDAPNLVPGDSNERLDVFVHDLLTRTTRRVSVNSNGEALEEDSYHPSLSADGRIVAFDSSVSYPTIELQVFVHERPQLR